MKIKRHLVTTAQKNLKNIMSPEFEKHTGGALAVLATAGDRGVICERSEGVQCYTGWRKKELGHASRDYYVFVSCNVAPISQ